MSPAKSRRPLLVVGTVLGVLTGIPSASALDLHSPGTPHADNVVGQAADGPSRTVTLLTGDRVTVTPGGQGPDSVTVEAPDGGRGDARVTRQGGDTYVYPAAADPYLAAGLLDTRLFDVTELLKDGYDDAHVAGLPLIVTRSAATGSRSARALTYPDGARDVRNLDSIGGAALTADRAKTRTRDFWDSLTGTHPGHPGSAPGSLAKKTAPDTSPTLADGLTKVWLDGKVKADLADSTAQIGAPTVWAHGNTGKGVDVAVLDSGYDPGHPDLAGVSDAQSFVPDEDVTDHVGHGTHVASTIAGSGAASGGVEKGVAPGVDLHVGKVLDDTGLGQSSWIIAGMQWAARDAKARVISMSLGTDGPTDGTDPLSQAVDELSEETGALFTIAAGNSGQLGDHTVGAPGAATDALTVGAVDADDTSADFSSRGPRLRDDAIKPEITAPGVDILAARSQYASTGSGPYTTMSGTSMATPHVAGVAALVAAAHPDWSGARIKDALVSSAHATPQNPVDAGGNGRVDAVAAEGGTLFATGTVDAGIHPLNDASGGSGTSDETVVKPVTWHNDGDQPVTLDLSVDAPDAPAGLFTVADGTLTVPAGGTASTDVTTHLDAAAADQRYTGQLVATSGTEVRTRTLLSVSTHEEYKHLRVHLTGRDGSPLPGDVAVFYQREGDAYSMEGFAHDGLFDEIVEPGTYTVWTWAAVEGTHGASSAGLALMSAPTVAVHTDVDVALDGTKLRQTKVTTPKKSTDSDLRLDFSRTYGSGAPPVTEARTVGDGFDSLWALPVAKPKDGTLLYTARWRMQQPLLSLTSGGQDFDDLWIQPGAANPADGDKTLSAVYEGAGTPADYAANDARGKIAVVDYAPEDDDFAAAATAGTGAGASDRAAASGQAAVPDRAAASNQAASGKAAASGQAAVPDQVQAAQDAGAAYLVMVNDLDGRLRQPVRKTPLTVAGISHTEGEALIARISASRNGSVPLRVVSHAHTGYLYDLVHTWHGSIPKDLGYAPKEKQLARVDVDFRNDPAQEVDEFRYDIEPYLGVKVGGTRLSNAAEHRTDWVTADQDVSWMEEATEGIQSFQYSGQVRYPAGRTTDVQWFGPVERPRLNESQQLPARTGNTIEASVPGWGDSGENHAGLVGPGTTSQHTALYRGSTELNSADGSYVQADVDAGRAAYRLVTTTQRTAGYPYSTSTSTEWGFTSAASPDGAAAPLPLVQLDYGIDTDASGAARRTADLLVTASLVPGAPAAAARADTVEFSYDDGQTWHRATVKKSGDGVTARLKAPKGARFASLRVHASDAKGNTVTQTVVRAVGLR